MGNLSLQNRFLMAALLPSLGVAILGISFVSSVGSPTLWFGLALIPTAMGIWLSLDSRSKSENAIQQTIDIVKKTANGVTVTNYTVTTLLGNLTMSLLNLNSALASRDEEQETDGDEASIKAMEDAEKVIAIDKAQAIIEFNMDGTIITANDNFLQTVGYRLDEVQGKHHSIFVEPEFKASAEYQQFWEKLNRGESESKEYKRLGNGGKEIWIQASYNPIQDLNGKLYKVVKFATDITQQKLDATENARIASALQVCQANVMMADADLNIVYLNDSVIDMLGNREKELQSVLSSFSMKSLMGTCVDDFHANPAHQRGMLEALKETYSTDLELAGLTFGLIATPVFDGEGNRSGTVVEWEDKTESLAASREAKKASDANERVRQALDVVGTATMIADTDLNIIYLNEAVKRMMGDAESDLREGIPNFNAAKLLGSNIDIYHKNPSHQRNMLANLSGSHVAELEIGVRSMSFIANSIEVDGERIGTVVEWTDRTAEVAIEKEINNLVSAANAGDYTIQLDESGKKGFFLNLTKGLNSLTATANAGLNDVLEVMGTLATGDLTNKLDKEYEGIFASMKDSVNATIDKLTEVISNISNASTSVRSGASEIASGNDDLSKRTEAQASSLEETASSMEEMTSVVKQSAENSKSADELAQSATRKAREGGVVVEKAIVAMEEINKSSSEIADIIGVIEEIAFQTNLLALNAAVEAARAGEQGRGFAVVAAEVRNLAQRSADASKDIKDLIRNSEAKVTEGSNLVNESGKTLAEIEEAVNKVSTMISDISAGAAEQTSGIEQVNTAVAQMDEMTQQNAALVEEAAASSEAVSEQAMSLSKMVAFFRVGDNVAVSLSSNQLRSPVISSAPARAPAAASDDEWEDF